MAASDKKLAVVATFSVLGDMVSRVGGEHISLTTLVGPNGDAHVYQPVPADARAVSQADLLVVNGLAFEGWLDRLVDASEFKGARLVATDGIDPIPYEEDDHHDEDGHDEDHAEHKDDDHDDHADHKDDDHAEHKDDDHADHKDDDHDDHTGHDHGAYDPHAWQSLENALIYVDNITAALSKADPAHASAYYANRAAYVAEISALEADIRTTFDALPEDARTVVTPHDAFGYFADSYDLKFLAPQGLSTDSEASAADVAASG